MRLPHDFVESPFFQFRAAGEVRAAAVGLPEAELEEMVRLVELRLPPVVSIERTSLLFGLNPGVLWSFCNRPARYYRSFTIKKGKGVRQITAPRVGLKMIQKWIGYHLSRLELEPHVFGFIPGRSHLGAARQHIGASWAISVDIEEFFPSTPRPKVIQSLMEVGYNAKSADTIAKLCTLNNRLVQGSPASPAISNLCFRELDAALSARAQELDCVLTRYADDVTFSGIGERPGSLLHDVQTMFAPTPWTINEAKTDLQPIKGRIKIHGLLIKEDSVKLTKGYRNNLRAYAHILKTKKLSEDDFRRLSGHVGYANQVDVFSGREPAIDIQQIESERFAFSRKRDAIRSAVRKIGRWLRSDAAGL